MATPGFTPIDEGTPKGFTPIDDAAPTQPSSSVGDYLREIGGGIKRGVQNLTTGMVQEAQPRGPVEQSQMSALSGLPGGQALGAGLGFIGHSYDDIINAAKQATAAREQSRQSGEGWAGQTLASLEKGPIIGGMVQYAEKGGTKPFNPQSIGAATEGMTYAAAPEIAGRVAGRMGDVAVGLEQRSALSRIIDNTEGLTRQGKTLNTIDKAAQAAFNKTKETLIMLQERLKGDAQKSIQPFLDADKARGESAIYPTQAAANVAKAISETDYTPKPAEQALLDQLSETTEDKIAKQLGYPDAETAKGKVGSIVFNDFVQKGAGGIKAGGLTLDQTLKLRSAIGNAMSRAKDPKAIKVLTEAYNGMNDSINGRLNDLQGRTNAVDSTGKPLSNKAFEQYNKNYKAAFQLNDSKSFTSKLMDETLDHHDARSRLSDFTDANLTEISQQMKDKGMNPKQIYQLQKDAKSVLAARDSVMGRYNKSLRGVMAGSPSEAALPLSVYAASRGAGLYGIVPYMLAVMAGRIPKNMAIMSDFAGTLDRLGVSQKAINTRVQPGPFMPVQPAAPSPESVSPPPVPSSPQPSAPAPVDTSNFPTPESRAASDTAFNMRYRKGEIPGKPMDPIQGKAWDESLERRSTPRIDTDALSQAYVKARAELGPNADTKLVAKRAQQIAGITSGGDIGDIARQSNPEPPRAKKIADIKKVKGR